MSAESNDELYGHDGTRRLRLVREYDATPTEVWDAWTDPRRLTRWLGAVPGPLGTDPVRMTFGDASDDWADLTVVRAEKPSLLELRWGFVGEDASMLRVQLEALGDDRTRLVLEHHDLGDSTIGYGAGWTAYLAGLAVELGGTDDGRGWDARFAEALPAWRERAQRASSATG